jgi:hypothetical protein
MRDVRSLLVVRSTLVALAILVSVAGCVATPAGGQAGSTPSQPATGSPASPGTADPTPVPNSVVTAPALANPGDAAAFPPVDGPQPTMVTPTAGATDVHPVQATGVELAMGPDRRIVARVSWTSGVEPCTVLAGVNVEADASGSSFLLTVIEGNGAPPGTMCTEQAVFKSTVVNLGSVNAQQVTAKVTGSDIAATLVID